MSSEPDDLEDDLEDDDLPSDEPLGSTLMGGEDSDVREFARSALAKTIEQVKSIETKGARASLSETLKFTHDMMQAAREIAESVFGRTNSGTVLEVYSALVAEWRYRKDGR